MAQGSKVSAAESDKLLRKELNLLDLTFLSLGGIIGSGWLFASLDAAAISGPSAVLAWIIGGILVMFVGLAYAELGSAVPKSGGIVRYPHYTHGSYTGYILGFLYLLSAMTVPAIEAAAAIEYITSISPKLTSILETTVNGVTVLTLPGVGLATILLIAFFFINYFGIKVLGKTNTGITAWKLVIPTLTFILLLLAFNAKNFTTYGGLFPSTVADASSGIIGPSAMLYAIPSAGIVFSYLGFRQAVEYSGEAKNPQKDVGRAVILALLIAIIIYTMLQVSFIGAINWSSAGIAPGNWSALLSSSWASGPFYSEIEAAGKALGIAILIYWGYVLLIDAVVSPSGTGLIYTGTTTRTFYGIAADGYFPQFFLKLNKHRIPLWSLIASLILGFLFLLPFPSWYLLVGFISSATVFTYIMGGIGLQTLRRTAPDLRRTVRIPAASIIAPIATLAALLIVYWSGFTTLFYVLSALFMGVPIFWMYYAVRELKMNYGLGIGLGIAQLLANIGLTYFGYVNIISASSASLGDLVRSFILYFLGFLGMLVIPTVVGYVSVNGKGRQYIRSGFWLIGLILVVYVISFFGGFGPLGSSAPIPFPYDTIVAAIIGLIFHYLAVRSGFRTDEIESIIKEQLEQG
ncbi:APC family permease [Saccharolobus caldissimus]|uniref:Amino acid permease n=1 Tax=Saccharolobus caldissimus TaxID=1702097 RepID=A0AAQ4CQ74_9CREN|nr:APC family permease [Saccharolobus caldissimus]BDB97955.1 amino acid permease [Saccharolobus caldissimus]